MILWCGKCGEYRKRGSSEWNECRYRDRHTMTPANEKIANEIDSIKARIAGADKPGGEDMGRLGALEAIKNALVDDMFGDESMSDAVDMTIQDGLHDEDGGAFFWIKRDGNWDLVRDGGRELAAAVSMVHKRRYGGPARSHSVRDAVELHAAQLRSDGAKRAAALAAFKGGAAAPAAPMRRRLRRTDEPGTDLRGGGPPRPARAPMPSSGTHGPRELAP